MELEALVRRHPTASKFGHNFSRRCSPYGYELISEMGADESQRRWNYSRRRKSLSYRSERAKQRRIFLKTYKLSSVDQDFGRSRATSTSSQRLKKAVVKVKSCLVSMVAFMRIHSVGSCSSRSSIAVAVAVV